MKQSQRASLSGLLILSLVAQAAIPLQVHTVLASDTTGQIVVVCTWNGPREHWWPHDGASPEPSAERLSPALLFSQLLASAGLGDHSVSVNSILVPITNLAEIPCLADFTDVASVYSIRAPPGMPVDSLA